MASTKHTVKNTAPGVRGLNTVSGYQEFEPGAGGEVELTAAELRNAKSTGYFDFDDAADDEDEQETGTDAPKKRGRPKKDQPDTGGSGDNLDDLDDATLLTTVAALSGKSEADLSGKSRDELLAIGRG